jgi:hypothetical protein
MGAGCSMETPPGLRSAEFYARHNFERLVATLRVPDDTTLNRSNLAEVASYCVRLSGSREILRELLPISDFRAAEAGAGTLIAIALLREEIVRVIITLNLDLSSSDAITHIAGNHDVDTINRESEYGSLGMRNLVYLHGNAHGDSDDWILTNEDIDRVAASGWGQLMATTLALSQITLFAGMGSSATAFTRSVAWVRTNLEQHEVFLASLDPGPVSAFATDLNIDAPHYIELGWNGLMQEIGRVVANEFAIELVDDCHRMQTTDQWGQGAVDCSSLIGVLNELDVVSMGALRANLLAERTRYLPQCHLSGNDRAMLSLTLSLVAFVAVKLEATSIITPFGLVIYLSPSGRTARYLFRSGAGRSWAQMEVLVAMELNNETSHDRFRKTILVRASDRPHDGIVPFDVLEGNSSPDDAITGPASLEFIDADSMLRDPSMLSLSIVENDA